MAKKGLIILLLCGVFGSVFSQKLEIHENPDEYIVEIGKVITRQKKPIGDTIYTRFQSTWTTLSDSQRVQFIALNKTLFNKRYTVYPYYTQLMNIVHHAATTQEMSVLSWMLF